jgi:hypothetical protein
MRAHVQMEARERRAAADQWAVELQGAKREAATATAAAEAEHVRKQRAANAALHARTQEAAEVRSPCSIPLPAAASWHRCTCKGQGSLCSPIHGAPCSSQRNREGAGRGAMRAAPGGGGGGGGASTWGGHGAARRAAGGGSGGG